ncbi:MAG: ankyrin repeat domain-containing protein [Candidatus Margulisbacteria bacterium]|nr:ankyrin repeat domain-containing protein [Candidatus Margulisiibacteriota bacterium]
MNYTIELIKAYSLDINYISPKVGMNQTALHRAAKLGDESIVLMLLNMGADPTIKDTHGNTPWDLVDDGTRLDKILNIAKILHPLMGASL